MNIILPDKTKKESGKFYAPNGINTRHEVAEDFEGYLKNTDEFENKKKAKITDIFTKENEEWIGLYAKVNIDKEDLTFRSKEKFDKFFECYDIDRKDGKTLTEDEHDDIYENDYGNIDDFLSEGDNDSKYKAKFNEENCTNFIGSAKNHPSWKKIE